jgi:putative transposase
MNESHVEFLNADSQALDQVALSDLAFDTDPSQILVESADPQKLRFRLIEWLAESPNRKVKSERKQAIANTLEISTRQVERLLNQYHEDRLRETAGIERSDKGNHRIHDYWQNYIREVYEKSLKEKHPLKPADVVREVQRHAVIDLRHEEGDYPHPATVYRILKPLVERQKRKQKIRNPGSGSWLAVETRDGKLLKADFSNQIIQCDHTKLDIRIVDKDGKLLNWRPWLTTVVDTFSSCLIGYHIWHKQPGAHEVALTLRHAILPKQYPPEYELEKPWNVYGPPLQYFFTDGGKDLSKSKLVKAIGKKLGFQCELRDRPPQGGIVERLFNTINTEVLAPLPGFISKEEDGAERAEKEACFTIEDIDKILAGYFCDDYNHQPYPKDPRDTRFERWFRGMGNKLPEFLNERELLPSRYKIGQSMREK